MAVLNGWKFGKRKCGSRRCCLERCGEVLRLAERWQPGLTELRGGDVGEGFEKIDQRWDYQPWLL